MIAQTDIEKIVSECRDELATIGITTPEVKVSTMRSTKCWGECVQKANKRTKEVLSTEIRINKALCDGDQKHEYPLKNTIIHELLHSATPFARHGKAWLELADKVNNELPYRVVVYGDYSKYGLLIHKEIKKEKLYIVKCEKCGQEIKRQRFCKVIANMNRYRCGKCGGDFQLVQTPEGIDVWRVVHKPKTTTVKIHI